MLWNHFLDVGKVNFDGFCAIASHFLEEDDSDAMEEELREAFRLYDKEGKHSRNSNTKYRKRRVFLVTKYNN